MDRGSVWRHIDAERTFLADLLESLPDDGWEHPSLCSGWTVRDVGAHLTFAQTPVRHLLWPAVRAGFRYDALVRDTALRSPLTTRRSSARCAASSGRVVASRSSRTSSR